MDYISALKVLKASREVRIPALEIAFYKFLKSDKVHIPFEDFRITSQWDLFTDDPEDGDREITLNMVFGSENEAEENLPKVKKALPKAKVSMTEYKQLPNDVVYAVMKMSDLPGDIMEKAVSLSGQGLNSFLNHY